MTTPAYSPGLEGVIAGETAICTVEGGLSYRGYFVGDLGYRLVLFPLTAFRVAMKAAEEALAELFRTGSQKNLLPRMQTRAELYDLLGYTGYEERDRKYFSHG